MFRADVLNMGGGRESNVDIRERLLMCAQEMTRCSASINLGLSPEMARYSNHRVPVVVPVDKYNGALPSSLSSMQIDGGLKPYSTHRLIDKGNPLIRSLGHFNVMDAGSDGSLNKTNLLYSGSFVIEYDLVRTDKNGKHYMYSEPSVLERIMTSNGGRTEEEEEQQAAASGCKFLDEVVTSSNETIKKLTDREGQHISSGKLLEDIMQLMRLYEEKTMHAEAACVDPITREIVAAVCNYNKDSGGLMPPMFGVAFLANAALMGLKIVFFPTALVQTHSGLVKDSLMLKHLLKMQLDILAEQIPKIVNGVEKVMKNIVMSLQVDIGGSANWNLPGHTKKTSHTSFPYHHARLRGHVKNVLEITNMMMVTSLGVIESAAAREWMYEYLGEFERRSSYSEKLTPLTESGFSEWRRNLLFSDAGPELPFRNKSVYMDLDFCLGGMCYHYLGSGQGILLSRRHTGSGERSGEGRIFAGVANAREGASAKDSVEDGNQRNDADRDGGGCADDSIGGHDGGSKRSRGKNSKRDKRGPSVEKPISIPIEVTAAYNLLLRVPMFITTLITRFCDKYGFFLGDKTLAPGLALRILTSTINERKACMDLMSDDLKNLLSLGCRTGRLKHSDLMQYAVLQLIMRYECQNGQHRLPEQAHDFGAHIEKKSWGSVNFDSAWKLAVKERSIPPTEDETAGDQQQQDSASTLSTTSVEHAPSNGGIAAIDNMVAATASTFASGADKKDTMFSWTMVTMAERFCALYNIISHPERYYKQLEREGLSYRGGLNNFKHMCSALAPELEAYVPKSCPGSPLKVCINAVRGYETAVERRKNLTNNKVCKIKTEEMKVLNGLNGGKTKAVDRSEINSIGLSMGCKTRIAFDDLFAPLRREAEAWEQEREDIGDGDISGGGANVIVDFFKSVNDNRSFKFRTSLCHRQEYVSVGLVRELERDLGRLLTIKHCVSFSDTELLAEIRKRSERMRDWVVPYTMPINNIDSFFDLSAESDGGMQCQCFQRYSGCDGIEDQGSCRAGCIELLVLPQSIHLKSLTTALKFNTMACERRYFSDVSTALGFLDVSPARDIGYSSIGANRRWAAFRRDKCGGEFLSRVPTSGLYEKMTLADSKTIEAFGPRFDARKKRADINTATRDGTGSSSHSGFFAGVWALCADHDLETTVIGSTVISPSDPTPLMKLTESESSLLDESIKEATEARNFFASSPSISFLDCFEEMKECMMKTNITGRSDSNSDNRFFSALVRDHGGGSQIPGVRMWIMFSAVSECFKNSLPLHWPSMVPNWSKRVLNLTEGVSNIDESGAVFEAAKFASVCARSFFGHCLNHSLPIETWKRLLMEQSWIGNLARAYEKAAEDSDIRVMESFIDSSAFLSNNSMGDKLKIDPTKDGHVKYSVWNEKSQTSLRKRAEWMETMESGMADRMSFSYVLCAVSLLRVTLEGDRVRDLCGSIAEGICSGEGQPVPLIRGLMTTSSWCKTFVTNATADYTLECIAQMRFTNIERDPLFFYRLAGYTIGLIAANDAILESITRRILVSFDFNGFDTSNWTRFIRHHFTAVLLGRRARLLSRPLALIKNLVGLTCKARRLMQVDRPRGGDAAADQAFEGRVCAVASRLGKLIMTKNVDSENVTANEILDCCIMGDEDVTADSVSSVYKTVRAELAEDKLDYSYNLASNACSNAQLAKIKTAARILNCNISFTDTSNSTIVIDADEEPLIDPSRGVAMSAGDAEVGRGVKRKSEDEVKEQQLPANKRQRQYQRTDVLYNSNSNSSSEFRKAKLGNTTVSNSHTRILSYDDATMDEDIEASEFEVMSRNSTLLKEAKNMLPQGDVNLNVVRAINKMKKFLTAQVPFNEADHSKLGVRPLVLKTGMEAIKRWNAAVERESAKLVSECEYLRADVGGEYDIGVVTPDDYSRSKNRNCAFTGEIKSYMTAPTSFANMFSNTAEEGNYSWLNFQGTEEKLSKSDIYNHGGGRLMGFAIKDMVEYTDDGAAGSRVGGGTAELRVLSELFSSNIQDSYWSSVMPCHVSNEDATGAAQRKKNSFPKEWWQRKEDKNDRERLVSSLKLNSRIMENKSTTHCSGLLTLYKLGNTTENPHEEEEHVKITDSPNDVLVTLGGDSLKQERYKCLYSLWHCNNGISPKNQIELLKKLAFKNTNTLWIKQYERHISILNTWGCLDTNNANDLHFSLSHGNAHVEVVDKSPPMSVFHSRYFDTSDYEDLIASMLPVVRLRKRLQGDSDAGEGELSVSDSELMSALYSREILSSCLDPQGKFYTSYVTNSASVLFTPGTSKRVSPNHISYLDDGNQAYVDQDFVGREKEIASRSFLAAEMEVIKAIRGGVFFQGEKAGRGQAPGLKGGRVLRPVNYSDVCIVEPKSEACDSATTTTAAAAMRGAMGVFESVGGGNVISEANDCVLLNCQKARCLMMSQRAIMNGMPDKRYDGQVFELNSMRYHAGVSKGYLLDDDSDLYSVHGQTNSSRGKKPQNDIALYNRCAKQYASANAVRESRIFLNDWSIIKYIVDLEFVDPSSVYTTVIPFEVSIGQQSSIVSTQALKSPLKHVSPHHRKHISVHSGGLCDGSSACFLANPCGPARRLLQRAPNLRLCVTNAGMALMSKRMAQTARSKGVEDLIMDGSMTVFKIASNSSCISVDSNRFFLIDGVYLIGGRIEDINIMTDMYTRCKLRSEKHVVHNSLFSPQSLSAFLATAIEGTVHSQGLALLEHVSAVKNNETSTRPSKNFWSGSGHDHGNDEDILVGSPRKGARGTGGLVFHPAGSLGLSLKPPMVFMNDEDYVFLRILYEVARAADNYATNEGDRMSTDSTPQSTSTRAALMAARKCYVECVDQVTGSPIMHAVYFFRRLLDFGGFCTAICSGDGEKSHHLVYTLNSVALNMAPKVIVMLVGPSGNNLKTTLVEVVKKAWFEKFADVSVGVLNSSSDSSASTQANIAYYAGQKNILIVDEVGYQGSGTSKRYETERGEERDKILGDLNEVKASRGMTQNTSAVWDQINTAMTDSKLKLCSRECEDVMAARERSDTDLLFTPEKRKRKVNNTVTIEENQQANDTALGALDRTPIVIRAFAQNAIWWNCMAGTVIHSFNEKRICYNLAGVGRFPFSVSAHHQSPWLRESDSILSHCSRPQEERGRYTKGHLRRSLYCLLGEHMADMDVTTNYALLLQTRRTADGTAQAADNDEEMAALWKESLKHESGLSDRVVRIYEDLVGDGSLLRWKVMKSTKKEWDRRPVLSCVPANEMFAELLSLDLESDATTVHRFGHEPFDLTQLNVPSSDGVLYAFHVMNPRGCGNPSKRKAGRSPLKASPLTSGELLEPDTLGLLGPVLGRVSREAIDSLPSKSRKLSSVIFGRGLGTEVDADDVIDMETKYDAALLDIMERPHSKGFPKITTDGSTVLGTSGEDCKNIMNYIKKIVEAGKAPSMGSFVKLCAENINSMDVTIREPSSLDPPAYSDIVSSMFGTVVTNSKSSNHNYNEPGAVMLNAKCKKTASSLCRFRSDGRTTAVSEIATVFSSSKNDASGAITKYMLPGQFNSNTIKKITSKHASAAMRGMFCKPVVSSITMTPIMTSNSYLYMFYVDEALAKRMVTFPCNTQFAFSNYNEDVQTFVDVVDNGLKCVHSMLVLERHAKLRAFGADTTPGELKKSKGTASRWVTLWNESVKRGMGTDDRVDDLSSVAALLPARALQLLVKNLVLEHRDLASMARLEKSANTFFHMYTTLSLSRMCERASRDEPETQEEEYEEKDVDLVGAPDGAEDEQEDNDEEEDTDRIHDEERIENAVGGSPFPRPHRIVSKKRQPRKTNQPNFIMRKNGKDTHRDFNRLTARPVQMCQINPKSLNTMAMAIAKCRQGAWAKINTAINCVIFVDAPFVATIGLYGEDMNLKMLVPSDNKTDPHIYLDWCIGLRLPNPDIDIQGYDREGAMIGAGAAISKQVCDAWGTMDIRAIMYSCHHLHMLFELVLQFSHPRCNLKGPSTLRSKKNKAGVDFVSTLFTYLIYREMTSKVKYPVFLRGGRYAENSAPHATKKNNSRQEAENIARPSPLEIPMFLAMIVNKPLSSLRATTNLGALSSNRAKKHSDLIKLITNQLGQNLNPDYLCPSCRGCLYR
uniref:Wsv343-like protein n=2 Tax=Trachysalambria curvirostris nimavirus TaxID=2984282 RepID=A0A9C7F8E4_9VIRU|nr:MAG: wsv343-like protein [Trachysalambria curvirostris nimavirus]